MLFVCGIYTYIFTFREECISSSIHMIKGLMKVHCVYNFTFIIYGLQSCLRFQIVVLSTQKFIIFFLAKFYSV